MPAPIQPRRAAASIFAKGAWVCPLVAWPLALLGHWHWLPGLSSPGPSLLMAAFGLTLGAGDLLTGSPAPRQAWIGVAFSSFSLLVFTWLAVAH